MTALDEYHARRALDAKRSKQTPVKKRAIPPEVRAVVHGHPCAACGSRDRVEAHHIVPRSAFSKQCTDVHDPANLMPLCNSCHVDHHTKGSGRRVPRSALTDEQLGFVLGKRTMAWIDQWYPEAAS